MMFYSNLRVGSLTGWLFCVLGLSSVSLLGTRESLAEDSVRLDPLRNAVEQADLIVRGTLTDVRRRDVFIRTRWPELRSLLEYYFDTGYITADEVLWGEISTNPIPVCFPSALRSFADVRTHLREGGSPPTYSEGASGYWILEPKARYLFYYVLPGSPDNMIPTDDPTIERLRELVSKRKAAREDPH